MGLSVFLLAAPFLIAQTYSSATIVNAATEQPELAVNGLATIYGKDFALEARSFAPSDMLNGELPTTLPGTGVRVAVEGIAATISYVSPTKITFLVPPILLPKRDAIVVVTVFGHSGPAANVSLMAESPGLFTLDPETASAARPDGTLIKPDQPAAPGEEVILYATGLGRTDPDAAYRQIPREPAALVKRAQFQVLLNGSAIPDKYIRYVGASVGAAGLYQVNFVIPEDCETNPSVQVAVGPARSQLGLRLPVKVTP